MYKAKENIRKFGADPTQPEFIINRGDLVELKSVDIASPDAITNSDVSDDNAGGGHRGNDRR